MPEGPELHLASRFVNVVCSGRVFTGNVVKSPVHKSDEIPFEAKTYMISASSRGKEMQLVLTEIEDSMKSGTTGKRKSQNKPKLSKLKSMKILFRFGMSGKFEFTPVSKVHKHSHLRFFTTDDPPMVLSHVDVRRFGRWEVDADWSEDRGPDPMFDYQQFRSNVVKNIDNSAFERPICEVLLNQKYFNGIGNYLRAEILYRLRIPPFEKAYNVLNGLDEEPPDLKPNVKGKDTKKKVCDSAVDILHLCHTVPLEVVNLGGGGYDPEGRPADYSKFNAWLQCYYQPEMNNLVDHNKRTIWFKGPAGPMVPKEVKSRSPVKKRKKKVDTPAKEEIPPNKKAKAARKVVVERQDKKKAILSTKRKTKSEDLPSAKQPRRATAAARGKTSTREAKKLSCAQDTHMGKGYATRSKTRPGQKT